MGSLDLELPDDVDEFSIPLIGSSRDIDDDWWRHASAADSAQIRELLRSWFSDSVEPCVKRLAELVLSCEPLSVVVPNERDHDRSHAARLRLRTNITMRCDDDPFEEGTLDFYIPWKPDADGISEALAGYKLDARALDVIRDCLVHFAGFGELPFPYSGVFSKPPFIDLTDNHAPFVGLMDVRHLWHDAFPFFIAVDGDMLIVRRTGETAWLICDEDRLVTFTSNVAEAIDAFVEFKKSGGPVFDAYAACDFLGRPLS